MSQTPDLWAIEACQVSYTYPSGVPALREVNLQVPQGRIVAIAGSNGSGKTTLMKVLMRLLKPTAGLVHLGESDLKTLAPSELYRRIGMVFQNPDDQLFAPTVEQDVAFGPRNLGLAETEVTERVAAALAAVEASALQTRSIHHLSFGEQKRVCLAGILAMQPAILLLDEPTAGLDPQGEAHMVELLLRLNRGQEITMIISTHAVDLLPVLADRICVLRQGHVHQEGTPQEIFADAQAARSAGLRLPMMAELFSGLEADAPAAGSLPLTLAEARLRLRELLARVPEALPAGREDAP